ncbi:TPA: DUF551 domain-containing protein [Klebsiella pneumoniae]
MTKSTITREQLLEIIETDHVQCGEASYLARMALGAMDSEPVAEVYQAPNVGICAALGPSIRMLCPLEPGTKLYRHAQPAPVVPELRVDWQENEFSAGWNSCRAAMLAAAPHDTPALNSVQSVVTVPGKWIPVSERMPEVGDIVLTAMGGVVNVGETECSAANCRFFTSVISGRELPATHWMQLPAAPQEVGDA